MKSRRSVSHPLVAKLLHDLSYSLQGNSKTLKGTEHPNRDARFRIIDTAMNEYQQRGES